MRNSISNPQSKALDSNRLVGIATAVHRSLVPALAGFLAAGRWRDSINTCCPLLFTWCTSLHICWKVICNTHHEVRGWAVGRTP